MATPAAQPPRPPPPRALPRPPPLRPRPQLFVSFRGEELRNSFVSHIVKALKDAGVNVFIDSLERKGIDIQNLLKRIDNSKIALVIFSDRFSESEWCLNEVMRMDERVTLRKLRVIPVFYRVSTYDVKNFKGKFGSCFEETVRHSPEEKHITDRWMSSVKSVASKTGFTSEEHRMDSNLVDAIVEDVKSQLPNMFTEKKTSTLEELFYTLVLAALCNFVAPLVFNDTSFYKTPQWFVGVSFLVIVKRSFS